MAKRGFPAAEVRSRPFGNRRGSRWNPGGWLKPRPDAALISDGRVESGKERRTFPGVADGHPEDERRRSPRHTRVMRLFLAKFFPELF
jgi:hypothetical protein